MNYTFKSVQANINKVDAKTVKANSGTSFGQVNIIDPPSGANCITCFIKVNISSYSKSKWRGRFGVVNTHQVRFIYIESLFHSLSWMYKNILT